MHLFTFFIRTGAHTTINEFLSKCSDIWRLTREIYTADD
jgi:hypothetical protein